MERLVGFFMDKLAFCQRRLATVSYGFRSYPASPPTNIRPNCAHPLPTIPRPRIAHHLPFPAPVLGGWRFGRQVQITCQARYNWVVARQEPGLIEEDRKEQ